jgi:hypothetical protein
VHVVEDDDTTMFMMNQMKGDVTIYVVRKKETEKSSKYVNHVV